MKNLFFLGGGGVGSICFQKCCLSKILLSFAGSDLPLQTPFLFHSLANTLQNSKHPTNLERAKTGAHANSLGNGARKIMGKRTTPRRAKTKTNKPPKEHPKTTGVFWILRARSAREFFWILFQIALHFRIFCAIREGSGVQISTLYTSIHTCIHTCIHSCVHGYVHTPMHASHACVIQKPCTICPFCGASLVSSHRLWEGLFKL